MLNKLKQTLSLIRFSHTIFALPFALASMLLAAQGLPPLQTVLLIIGCMVLARTSAMAFNRYVDADLDAANPRTQDRHLPRGLLSKTYVLMLAVISGLLFVALTWLLNPLSFLLSPVALFIIWLYSYTKRFTHYAQLFLGLALACSPVGAWIAVRGTVALPPILLALAVAFWAAGFDIFYATQDHEFDKQRGLKSLVVKYGIAKSLLVARAFHVLTALFLLSLARYVAAPVAYIVVWGIVSAVLIYEHSLVRPHDLSRVNQSFFALNGWVGIIYLLGTGVAVLWS